MSYHTSERTGPEGRVDSNNHKPYLKTHNGWGELRNGQMMTSRWNEDTVIGSTTPDSFHRGSRSLPAQCGPANIKGMTNLAMWTLSIAFHYNPGYRVIELHILMKIHLENGVPLLQHNLIPP